MSNVWVWVGHVWTERVRLVLDRYGDRITDISIFGWQVDATGKLTRDFDPALLDPYRAKWPHLRFWLCFRNDGDSTIFTALRTSVAARQRLLADLGAALDEFPWLVGVDIDLERGGGTENTPAAESLFRQIANLARARGRKCAAALPPLTASGSVGGEDWVRYRELGRILDHVEIMSYDFAWMGSAPGPVSPGFWLRDVYEWAVSQIPVGKISMGLPLYAYFWHLHDYPANLGDNYRGDSGTFYAAWQHLTGYRAYDGTDANPAGSGSHHRIGWLAFRDDDSRSAWAYLDVYDWRDAAAWDTSTGLTREAWDGKPYAVRYGLPAGDPLWSVADLSAGASRATYQLEARRVRDVDGALVAPKSGFTLTAELLQRDPVAATIIDDYATTGQLDRIYTHTGWSEWAQDGHRQYRGSGPLSFDHDFGTQALYLQARFQWAGTGWAGVTVRGFTAEAHPDGRLRLRSGPTVLAETTLTSRRVGAAPGEAQVVVGLRVRENSARVYFSWSEQSVPQRLHVPLAPPGGPVGLVADAAVWVDHVYLGDGWWYAPREAVEVSLGGQTRLLGRRARTGIQWDAVNRFRPTADVDEHETRTGEISADWVYEHWPNVPIAAGQARELVVRPVDHDVWLGRLLLCDRAGAGVVYFSDVETIVHWRDRARLDFGLDGIALWTLGQEDVRVWERMAGGYLPPETKRLNS